MRRLVLAFAALALLSELLASHAEMAVSAPSLTSINLTQDTPAENYPSIGWTLSGDLIVAWEQNVPTGTGSIQTDIMARVQRAGAFGPRSNISNDPVLSRQPSVFSLGQFGAVLYQEPSPGTGSILRSDWSGTDWSPPQVVAGGDYPLTQDPVGVQASDGSIWIARWVRNLHKRYIILKQLGGPSFIVSPGGNVTRLPGLAAGDNGEVYVSWVDHTDQPPKYKPGVRVARVTTAGIVYLPQSSFDYYAYWPRIAYNGGLLYSVWTGTATGSVRERVWNGSAWGSQSTLGPGTVPRVAVTPGNNVYAAWQNNGRIYLKMNASPARIISGKLGGASQPALTVDASGNAHVVFVAQRDIWYVMVPAQ